MILYNLRGRLNYKVCGGMCNIATTKNSQDGSLERNEPR